jgi:hypothetical protein
MDGKYAGCEIEEGAMALFASPRTVGLWCSHGKGSSEDVGHLHTGWFIPTYEPSSYCYYVVVHDYTDVN